MNSRYRLRALSLFAIVAGAFVVIAWQSAGALEFRKGPYLIFVGDQSQMRLLWQLDSTATCTVAWGEDTTYSSGSAQCTEYGDDHQHDLTLTNLTPAIRYFYRVVARDIAQSAAFYSAPDSMATAVKFIAYGDTRTYPAIHNQVAAAITNAWTQDSALQSLVISVGDLVYHGDIDSEWTDQLFDPEYAGIHAMLAGAPYQSARGNHEQSALLFATYFPYPFVAGRYWSFDYGPAHFAMVDQYVAYGPGSAQLLWLENDLAASTKQWKFVCLHEPGWTAGGHANNTMVQNYIQPLCEQYGVSIIFGGHNHYYSRAEVNGIEHITTGGGGAPLTSPNPGYPNVVLVSGSYHFCKIGIDGGRLLFSAVSSTGAILDTFSLGPICSYMAGDINGNNAANGIDVVYGVNYLKGGTTPPFSCDCPPHGNIYAAGDVNGNCAFNGIDITFYVAYLKGLQPALRWCEDCPPIARR